MADGVVTIGEVTVYGVPWYESMDSAAVQALDDIIGTSLSEGVEY